MKFRAILSICLAGLCLGSLAMPAMAAEVESGAVYCFGPEDFAGSEDLAGICITDLPDGGTLMLGSRILHPGDILTVEQAEKMTFHAESSETSRETEVTYLPVGSTGVKASAVMSITVVGKRDQAPVAEDSTLETYRNLPNEGLLKVKDPENQPMHFTVTRIPRRGTVVVREDGSFIYTPKKNKVGVDSFTYTATDPAGNVSREATVTITILKPSDAAQYSDTAGESCRFAAEWMKNTGIFISESLNGNGCFQPEKQVSRGEFLTMLVGALEIPVDQDAVYTGFSDEAPEWLKPYLAAAMRHGLTVGWPEGERFGYEKPITGAEAAVMVQNVLDLTVGIVTADEAVPAWAQQAVSALRDQGIQLEASEVMTRGRAAEVIYRVWQLRDSAPGMKALKKA